MFEIQHKPVRACLQAIWKHHSRASTLLQLYFEQSKNCTSLLSVPRERSECIGYASDQLNIIRVQARSYKYILNKVKTVRACLQAMENNHSNHIESQ